MTEIKTRTWERSDGQRFEMWWLCSQEHRTPVATDKLFIENTSLRFAPWCRVCKRRCKMILNVPTK